MTSRRSVGVAALGVALAAVPFPDGAPAPGNAALVRAAVARMRGV